MARDTCSFDHRLRPDPARRGQESGRYRVSCLSTAAEIEAFLPAWAKLDRQRTGAYDYFQTSEWCGAWLRQHGGPAISPRIYVAWDADRAAAVWPLMIERQPFGLRVLQSLGAPHTQYAGILLREGADAEEAAAVLCDAALSGSGADLAAIQMLPVESALTRAIGSGGGELACQASILDLTVFSDGGAYLASLSKTQRRNRNRRRQQLARAGDLSFRVITPEHPDFASRAARCLNFKMTWLERTGRVSLGLALPRHAAFLASLPSSAMLSELSAGGQPVAIEIGFLRNGHYYAYMGSFDWAWRDASPGKVQMDMTVGWLIDNGVKAYDLLASSSDYKESWSNTTLRLQSHLVGLTAAGSLYASIWYRTSRPALRRLMLAVPETYRAGLRAVLKQRLPFLA